MMKISKFIYILFLSAIAIAMSACVPKATEKKAVCGANQAFNSVSRSCVVSNVVAPRAKPVGTTSSNTLSEEVAKTITLSYTDGNSDQAVSCAVSGVSANIEAVSPHVINGNIFNKADLVFYAAQGAVNALPLGDVKTAALNEVAAMQTALDNARATFNYSNLLNQLGLFNTAVNNILATTTSYTSSYTAVNYYYNLTQSRLVSYSAVKLFVDNRCDCTGGVCTTTIAPRIHQTGAAGFNYTISDIDGEGNSKSVSLSIAAMSTSTDFLRPAAGSEYVTFSESATSAATASTFTLPTSRDYFGTTSFSYSFGGSKDGSNYGLTTNGKVSGCMDLVGSTGVTDKTCTYTPNNGDTYSNAVPAPVKAIWIIGDLTFTALKEGNYGNNFTVQYFDLQDDNTATDSYVTKTENFGLVSLSYADSFVRVVGNEIRIFLAKDITSSSDIKNLVNNDSKAKTLVLASGGATTTFPDPATLTPAALSLATGANAFDTIPYTVSNGYASSTNTANVMIAMTAIEDAPEYNSVASFSTTAVEDSGQITINLSSTYSDAELNADACDVDAFSSALFLTYFTVDLCTCAANVCTLKVTANANVDGTHTLYYRVGSAGQYAAYHPYTMDITSVNDAPTIPAIADTSTNEDVAKAVAFTIADVDNTLTCAGSVSATNSTDATLIPTANVVITGTAPNCTATITPAANKSGPSDITLTVTDGNLSASDTFTLTVNQIDDAPTFVASITSANTNEGGMVVAGPFTIDEDAGSSADENDQEIKITGITSDNSSVLPATAITIFYDLNDNGVEDNAESRAINADLDSDPTDSKLHNVYLKLNPVAGEDGNANVTITINDGVDPSHSVTTTFSLIVHPVAAIHRGWANISAIGIKSDKNGLPAASADVQCNYNKSTDLKACETNQNCTGTSAPHASVSADEANVIYWDTASKKCYRSMASGKFSWVDFNTTCPVTRLSSTLTTAIAPTDTSMTVGSTKGFPTAGIITINLEKISYTGKTVTAFTGLTRGINSTTAASHLSGVGITFTGYAGNLIADTAGEPNATADQYYYNTDYLKCYKSKEVAGVFSWDTATAYKPSKVTLSWNAFTVTGSGPDSSVQTYGWNVYRREAGKDYDYVNGFLKTNGNETMTISDATVRTFTDTTAVAGNVYYYLVRPVDSTTRHLTISTPEIFSEVRIFAPTENYAFVHRWMVNQEVCNSMHRATTIDPTYNFRCPYNGPGQITDAGVNYYDIGKDMLVDISESGCPYTAAPSCTSNGGIGIGIPSTVCTDSETSVNDIYYNRSSGSCYIKTAAATWVSYNNFTTQIGTVQTAMVANANSALNAPISNISQAEASSICTNRTLATPKLNVATPTLTAALPTKKEYIAYSASPYSMTDSLVTDMEQGFSLNIQSRCNSSNANGIDVAFTDSNIPLTSFIYSLPGTASSGIRSLYTGSVPWGNNYSTETCSSRYGIQDVYGNVAEWLQDNVTCDGLADDYVCKANAGTALGDYDFDTAVASGIYYGFDYVTGPYNEASGDSIPGAGDGFLTNWDFRDELFGAGKFSFPVGMPINVDIASANANQLSASAALLFLLDIGPTAGITSSQLHEDGIIVNGANVNAGASKKGYFAQGGSYLSGNFSGRYSSELIPSATVRPDVGFRCYLPIDSTDYIDDSDRHPYSY